MPNPKRRHSKTRTATRRAHDHLKAPGLALCPNCHRRIHHGVDGKALNEQLSSKVSAKESV